MNNEAAEWRWDAPTGWKSGRLKDLVGSVRNGLWGDEPDGDDTAVPVVRGTDFDRARKRVKENGFPLRKINPSQLAEHRLRRGDLILEKSGGGDKQPVGMAVLYDSDTPAVCTNFCARLTPSECVESRYLMYVMAAAYSVGITGRSIKQTTGLQNLDSDAFFSHSWMWPEIEEQRRIADFLDAETSRIDKVLSRNDQQNELLLKRRRSFIESHLNDAFSGGKEAPLRYIMKPSFEDNRPDFSVLSVYRDFGIVPKDSRSGNHNKTPDDVTRYLVVHPGDVVFNKMKAWQGSVGVSRYAGIVSPDYLVARVIAGGVETTFLHYLLRSPRMTAEYASRSRGIRPSQWRLYWEDLASISVQIPTPSRQREIVDQLEREDRWVETALEKLTSRRRLVAERRQALITAAVTGQFEISTASGRTTTQGV